MIESARQATNGLEEHRRAVAKGELPRDARYVQHKTRGLEFLEDDWEHETPMGQGGKSSSNISNTLSSTFVFSIFNIHAAALLYRTRGKSRRTVVPDCPTSTHNLSGSYLFDT